MTTDKLAGLSIKVFDGLEQANIVLHKGEICAKIIKAKEERKSCTHLAFGSASVSTEARRIIMHLRNSADMLLIRVSERHHFKAFIKPESATAPCRDRCHPPAPMQLGLQDVT